MKEKTRNILQRVIDECSGCGVCSEECNLLQKQECTFPGGIAKALIYENCEDAVREFVLKCSLCGLCHELCPEEIDIVQMVLNVREDLIEAGVTDAEQYRFLWVDHDYNAFSLYRRSYRLDEAYQDIIKENCEVIFFPGCMLVNESPSLVREAGQWLEGQGQNLGVLLNCCGGPLVQIGLAKRAQAYNDFLWREIQAAGARRVVTACPTCHAQLIATTPPNGIEIVSLFKLMAESGLKAQRVGSGTITVHDSCTDRNNDIGQYVRKLLNNFDIKEMDHHGKNTICCGSGGIVSAIDPEICAERAETRIKEVVQTGADICVTSCMSCAHRLANQAGDSKIRHILELVLNQRVDHEGFNEKSNAMWEDEAGEENAILLGNSQLGEV